MKVLLVRPAETFLYGHEAYSYGIPLGIGYIAAVLKRAGYNAVIYDGQYDSFQDVKKRILKENPDIIGISNQFSSQFENAKKVAEIAKDINKNCLVIVGGSHPSSCPQDFFTKTHCVDIVVIGEGEYAFLEILNRISDKKLWQCPPIQNLDELPYPAYELFNMEKYFNKLKVSFNRPGFVYPGSERAINIIISRGCPYNCVFCSIHSVMGNVWRANSPGYVIEHIKFLIKNHRIRHIHFEDDNLTLDKERLRKILNGILENNFKITWDTPNGVRADMLDEDILKKCKKAGCIYLTMGVESGDQYVLDNIIQKRLSLKTVEKIAALAKKIRLNLEAFFVIGFPGETIRDMRNTLNFAFRLQFKYSVYPLFFIATLLPGTQMYDLCLEKDYITKDFPYSKISSAILKEGMIETEEFKLKDIRRLFLYFKIVRALLAVINFITFCTLSPIFAIKKIIYLFRISCLSSKGIKFDIGILLRNLIRYNFVSFFQN